jgi:hypothetical protein
MVGKGSARQGSDYQSGGIANRQGSARRGRDWQGWARRGVAGTLLELVAVPQIVKAGLASAGHGKARSGRAGLGKAR